MVAVVVLAPLAPFVGTGAVGTASASDGIHYVTDSGFEVEDTSGGSALPSFPDDNTLTLPGITLSSSGNAFVTLDQRTGTFTNLTNIDDSPSVTVDPDDKQEVGLNGNLDSLNFSTVSYGSASSGVDLVYSAASEAGLRVESTGLPEGYTVEAVDLDTGTTLDTATVSGDGSITFSALDSGSHTVTLRGFDTVGPSISSFDLTQQSDQVISVSFTSDEQLSTISVSIDGPETTTLTTGSFSETDNGDGTFTYEATYSTSTDGNYTATLDTAEDDAGNDGATGQTDTIDTTNADFTIESMSTTSPIQSGDSLSVTATITNTGTADGESTVEFSIRQFTDSTTVSLAQGESETVTFEWNTGSRYAGEFTAEISTADDTATRTVLIQGDGPVFESAVVSDQTPDRLEATFDRLVEVTNGTAGFDVTLDGSPVDIQSASSSDQTVTLVLGTDISHDDTLRFSYDNASQNLKGTDGVSANSVTDASVTNQVEQDPGVAVEMSASSYVVGVDSTVTLRAEATGAALEAGNPTYTWSIDGETVQTDNRTLTWTFDQPGEFDASVTADVAGETDTDTITVTVRDGVAPVPEFTASETVTPGEDPDFDATASSDNIAIASYEWAFGDGTTRSGDSLTAPSHSYDEPGVYEVSLTVTDTSGNQRTTTQTVTVEAPAAVLDTDTRDFGDVGTGSSATDSIAITNNGTTPLSVTDISIEGADAGAFSLDASTLTVRPGATQSVGVTFEPTAAGTVTDATLVVETNNSNPSTFEIALNGEGVESSLEPVSGTISLGSVDAGQTATTDVEFTNTGGAATNLTNATLASDQMSLVEELPVEVPAGETASVTVEFAPTANGPTRTSLSVETTAGDTASVTLTGNGVAPKAYFPTDTLRVGTVSLGDTGTASLEIRNDGSDVLTVDDLSIQGGASDAYDVVSAPETLQPDETGTITVEFAPERPGQQQADLAIGTDDPDNPTTTISLDGTGQGATIDVNPRIIDFEETDVGEPETARITITNRDDTEATLTVDQTTLTGTNPGDFEILSGQAPFELAPGESTDIVVEFSAQAVGQREAQLQIRSDAGNEPFASVWLTNTRSYIIVEDASGGTTTGAIATEAATQPTVNIAGSNIETGNTYRVNVSTPTTLAEPVTLETLGLQPAEDGDFEMNAIHSETALANSYSPAEGRDVLRYVSVEAVDVPDGIFEETSVEFRIDRSSVSAGTAAEDITIRRYDDGSGQWETLDAELVSETPDTFQFSAETTIPSEFVVTGPAGSSGAQLLIDDVTIPAQLPQESTVEIEAALSNPGASSVAQDVTLSVEGTSADSQRVNLERQSSQTVTFEYALGKYDEVDRGDVFEYYDENDDGILSNGEIFEAVQDWQRQEGYFAPIQVAEIPISIETGDDQASETVPVVDALTSEEANNAIFTLVQRWQEDSA
jgi:hypothetical protein